MPSVWLLLLLNTRQRSTRVPRDPLTTTAVGSRAAGGTA
eukprot:COSAG01_NODE_1706_length_9427_cov_51.196934_2_plen_39_part_00